MGTAAKVFVFENLSVREDGVSVSGTWMERVIGVFLSELSVGKAAAVIVSETSLGREVGVCVLESALGKEAGRFLRRFREMVKQLVGHE